MEEHKIVSTGEGVTRQVLTYNDELMLVKFSFKKGGVGEPHHHKHIQSTYVNSGHFLFTVDGVEHELKTGDSVTVPSDKVHSCIALEDGVLVDAFTPKRDDFL